MREITQINPARTTMRVARSLLVFTPAIYGTIVRISNIITKKIL